MHAVSSPFPVARLLLLLLLLLSLSSKERCLSLSRVSLPSSHVLILTDMEPWSLAIVILDNLDSGAGNVLTGSSKVR